MLMQNTEALLSSSRSSVFTFIHSYIHNIVVLLYTRTEYIVRHLTNNFMCEHVFTIIFDEI